MKTNTEKFLERMEALGLRDQLAEVPQEAGRDDGKNDDDAPPPIDIDAIRRKLGPRKPIHWFGCPAGDAVGGGRLTRAYSCARVSRRLNRSRALTARAQVDAVSSVRSEIHHRLT